MSEKIVQLNEEVIKGQIEELVRGSIEGTLNELLEKEAEPLTQRLTTSATRPVRATTAATMTRTLPRPPETLRSICLGSRACPSKRLSSSGIAAGKAA